jgi:hypothetical protein
MQPSIFPKFKGSNADTVTHPLRCILYLIVQIAHSNALVNASLNPSHIPHDGQPDNTHLDALMDGKPAKHQHPATALPAIDYEACDPYLVRELGLHLETMIGLAFNGTRALGHLLALASAEVEDGSICGNTVEGLGWLLSELGDVGAWATVMRESCLAATKDFSPSDSEDAR